MDKRKKSENIEEVTLDDDDEDADSAFESASDGSKDFEYDFDGLDPKKSQKLSISNESVKTRVKTEKDTPEFPDNVREVYKNVLIRLQSRLKNNNTNNKANGIKKEKESI